MDAATRRLFIGLWPDDALRHALTQHQRRWHWGAGRPTPAERLHLTLHFLGEIDAPRERALRAALADEAVAPFELVLRTAQCWPGGLAVLRPDANAALYELHRRLAGRLRQAAIEPPRGEFTPHVTLARGAPNAAAPETFEPVLWPVRAVALVWSRPGPPRRYELISRFGADTP